MDHLVILERDGELAALSAAAVAAEAGHGALVLVEGPAGIGKTTLLRAACQRSGLRTLTARGLALERGFPYGIVRQLLDPVRAAAGPAGWQRLLDGAAGSPSMRAARCASQRSDGTSAQCASSTAITSGRSAARLAASQ